MYNNHSGAGPSVGEYMQEHKLFVASAAEMHCSHVLMRPSPVTFQGRSVTWKHKSLHSFDETPAARHSKPSDSLSNMSLKYLRGEMAATHSHNVCLLRKSVHLTQSL